MGTASFHNAKIPFQLKQKNIIHNGFRFFIYFGICDCGLLRYLYWQGVVTAHSEYLPPLRGLIAAGIVEAHHPGIADAEVVNFEIRIAALQTHTQAGGLIFTLAGSSEGRNQQRGEDVIHASVLPGLTSSLTFEDDSIIFLVKDSTIMDGESPDC